MCMNILYYYVIVCFSYLACFCALTYCCITSSFLYHHIHMFLCDAFIILGFWISVPDRCQSVSRL